MIKPLREMEKEEWLMTIICAVFILFSFAVFVVWIISFLRKFT